MMKTRCRGSSGVVVFRWLTVESAIFRAGRSVILHAACQEGVDEMADKRVSFAACSSGGCRCWIVCTSRLRMLQLDRTTDDLGCTRPRKQDKSSSLIHSQRRKRKRERGRGSDRGIWLIHLGSVWCRDWLRGHTEFARVGGRRGR